MLDSVLGGPFDLKNTNVADHVLGEAHFLALKVGLGPSAGERPLLVCRSIEGCENSEVTLVGRITNSDGAVSVVRGVFDLPAN